MTAKIEKIIARLQEKTAEGAYYEAQQQTRVVAARYVKQKDYAAAASILFNVASSLLKAGQGGSGGDLGLFLVDVYRQAECAPDTETKGKLLALLRLFGREEPTRKKFIAEMMAWSSKYGEYPAGEPDLHHVAGSLYAAEGDAYDAERHLVLGTKDSPEVLARLEHEWYRGDDSHTAALYAARAVLPYLLLGNVRYARLSLGAFTGRLAAAAPSLTAQDVSSGTADVRVYPSLPLLNFLSLLLLTVQKGSADLFRGLTAHYAAHLAEVSTWTDALDGIAEMYFGIQKPRQGNPLLDMMGMFGVGGAPKKQPLKRIVGESAPVAEGLD